MASQLTTDSVSIRDTFTNYGVDFSMFICESKKYGISIMGNHDIYYLLRNINGESICDDPTFIRLFCEKYQELDDSLLTCITGKYQSVFNKLKELHVLRGNVSQPSIRYILSSDSITFQVLYRGSISFNYYLNKNMSHYSELISDDVYCDVDSVHYSRSITIPSGMKQLHGVSKKMVVYIDRVINTYKTFSKRISDNLVINGYADNAVYICPDYCHSRITLFKNISTVNDHRDVILYQKTFTQLRKFCTFVKGKGQNDASPFYP